MNENYGVSGNDFSGNNWIGMCEAKYHWGGPWLPLDGNNHTVCGDLFFKKRKKLFGGDSKSRYHIVSDGDGDFAFYLFPDSSFRWSIEKSNRTKGHYFKENTIGCEVGIKEPGNDPFSNAAVFLKKNMIMFQGKKAGVYGAWVTDVRKEQSPELHPIQQLWIVDETDSQAISYNLFAFLDNTSRFINQNNFPDSCGQPWIRSPMEIAFYIPFEISLSEVSHFEFRIEPLSSYNSGIDSPDNIENEVKFEDRLKLKIVNPHKDLINVEFQNICKNGSTIRGYCAVKTILGKVFQGRGGHCFFVIEKRYH